MTAHFSPIARPLLPTWWPLPLRLIVGYGFIAHGCAKLARGPDKFAHILAALGVPAPDLMAWATVAVELVGGLTILTGAFVQLAALPMGIVLGGAGPLAVDTVRLGTRRRRVASAP